MTGKIVLQQLLSLPSYFPLIDLPLLTSPVNLEHHIVVITRSQLDVEEEVQKQFKLLEKSDLVDWNYSYDRDGNEIVYSTTVLNEISISVKINITAIKEPDSTKWAHMIPHHISISDPLANLSIISCLGSTSSSSKKSGVSREWVDKTLNLDILKSVLNNDSLSQKLSQYFLMTSFNNFAISTIFPYFKSKKDLETTAEKLLRDHRASITILRPGPLVGRHGYLTPFVVPELDDHLVHSIYEYQKAILRHYTKRINEWRKVGVATRASEIVAKVSYNMPCGLLLGYPVKAEDCAFVLVTERMKHFKSTSLEPRKVTYFSSQQIDSYKEKIEAHI